MAAQISARDTEILDPFQIASKVDPPAAPVPKIQWMLNPNFSMAACGVRCYAEGSIRLPKRSYSTSVGYR